MTGFDISDTLAPKSDQLDAIELVEPRTFTIREVTRGSDEQPINVYLVEFPRPWRPGVSMRRVLRACWGADASKWVGRRVTLFNDTEVMFGKDKTGGTRIKALSDIDGPKKVPLLVARGKTATYTVEPLPTAPDTTTELRAVLELARTATSQETMKPHYKAAVDMGIDQVTAKELRAIWDRLPDTDQPAHINQPGQYRADEVDTETLI
jgi:hypothetical protein